MAEYRVGIASMVHDHVWGELQHWSELDSAEIVAAGDDNDELRRRIAETYDVPNIYDSWQEMIETEDLDIVQAASENATAPDIVEAATEKGIHIVSEKPMSATLDGADRMIAAAETAGTKLVINWPNAWDPEFQTMDRMVTQRALGQPFYIKYRAAHNGPKEIGCSEYFWNWLYDAELNGAGALMDYCCYASAMAAHWLGRPNSCIGTRSVLAKDYPIPDDNAMIIAKYEDAYAVAEASWTQKVGTPGPNPIVYCSDGAIGIEKGELKVWQPTDAIKGLEEQTIEPDAPERGYRNGPEHLIWCIENDEQARGICNAKSSRNAQEILQAGLDSADTGTEIDLPVNQ